MSAAAAFAAGSALAGRGIVVTRPREQSTEVANLIRAAGGRAILFPALEIVDGGNRRRLNALIDRLDQFDYAIFISPTAVGRAMGLIRARRQLPQTLRIAAIGRGSARELRRFGIEDVLMPADSFDSEGLLGVPELGEVRGKSIVIFRGEGGRELLGDTLAARGATIEHAECYRRVRPSSDSQPLLRGWARGEIHAIMVTSGEALRNLFEMVGTLGRPWLLRTPLFVPHERIAAAASELGIARVVVTEQGDEGLVSGLIGYFAGSSA
jgi:uroporphyrinogen-III synthase